MKNILILTIIILIICPGSALGKLAVGYPTNMVGYPTNMLERANVIIVGKVIRREYREDNRKVVISIEEVIKGKLAEKVLTFEQKKPGRYGWMGFEFPEINNKVFLLLHENPEDNSYRLGLNTIAVIDNEGKMKITDRTIINGMRPEDYAVEYEQYYQAYKLKAKVNPFQGSANVKAKDYNTVPNLIGLLLGVTVLGFMVKRSNI